MKCQFIIVVIIIIIIPHTGYWFLGGDDLTGALHDLYSSDPVFTTTSFASINTG